MVIWQKCLDKCAIWWNAEIKVNPIQVRDQMVRPVGVGKRVKTYDLRANKFFPCEEYQIPRALRGSEALDAWRRDRIRGRRGICHKLLVIPLERPSTSASAEKASKRGERIKIKEYRILRTDRTRCIKIQTFCLSWTC